MASGGSSYRAVRDYSSQSNPHEVRVEHTNFQWSVLFESRTIKGVATLRVVAVQDDPSGLVLDIRDLTIDCVLLEKDGSGVPLSYSLDDAHSSLGTALQIGLPNGIHANDSLSIAVVYSTSPTATAIQWLEAEQTAGGVHPYLFTQCQAIHARSLFPCQDTPAVKSTYTATVTVPAALTALMSAVPVDDAKGKRFMDRITYRFEQKVPIPSYLVALAVGQLESRRIGPRSHVWSEPSMVELGEYEFADTEKFLAAGEALLGEYVWGVYDLLLLPPSFPYGGMENPCLTFVTPTLIAGDRSLANVVAHEIAHSWTGNLVTNSSWEHFWLNEGFTVFVERKIIGRLHGESTLHAHAIGGLKALHDSVEVFGRDHKFTCLLTDLSNAEDPDDAFSSVPYEKGFNFLFYLQTLVGGSSAFEAFLRAYIDHFKYKTLDTQDFKDFFLEHFKGCQRLDEIDWEAWLRKPGMPPTENDFDSSLIEPALKLAQQWHEGGEQCSSQDIKGFTSEQAPSFAALLDSDGDIRHLTILQLEASRNAEIRCCFYELGIASEDESVVPLVARLLREQGRMKYLRPLYRALFKSKVGKEAALATFADCRNRYHPIASKMVASDLQLKM
eukprot:jgi/Chlat1/1989/Chrsp158S02286